MLFLLLSSGALACSGRSAENGHEAGAGAGNEAGGGNVATPIDPGDPANFACVLGDCKPIGERIPPKPGPRCPVEEPTENSPCDVDATECSYGDSLTAYCRRYLKCSGGVWTVPPNRPTECPQQPAAQCPAKPPADTHCVASNIDGFVPCEYSAGVTCYCLGNPVGVPGSESQWECYGPPRNGACPEALPNLGDGCDTNGQACHYGIVQLGCHAPYADVYCYQGAWEAATPTCSL